MLAAGSMLDLSPDALIDVAAAAGFDGVGLRLSGEHAAGDPRELARRAARRGIVIFDAEVHRVSASATDPEPLLRAAATAGAEALLVVSDLPDRDRTMGELHGLATACRSWGLRLGLEYMAWTTPSDPMDAIAMADGVGCELVVDVLHHVRVGAGRAELDAVVASGRLGWVQLCDASPAVPEGPGALIHEARHGRVPPGAGGLPLGELVARIPDDVTISVEVQSDELRALAPLERATLLHDASRSVLDR
jgi:sugar phosphate isomerase/epimerase